MSVDASRERALALDESDPLRALRLCFAMPRSPTDPDREAVYMTGNSLGPMPRGVPKAIQQEIDDWARIGVDAHLEGAYPWYSYHESVRDAGARLVGALPHEVVMMNSLTVNLHLMMASFYRPDAHRRAIMIEDAAFPSDSYAAASQLRLHDVDVRDGLVRLAPRDGEHTLRTEDIIDAIRARKADLALVLLPGVNYLTGQVFDMRAITDAGHQAGAIVGWDLAHAAGNIPMRLHDWGADFACWCSYKYLNAGPGAVAGCFVHERHGRDTDLPRMAGWWGTLPTSRFQMAPDFVPAPGADGWQLSNPPILSMAPLRVSLEIFDRVGMDALRAKSEQLTGYLLELIDAIGSDAFEVITPRDPAQRGCQLSLAVHGSLDHVRRTLKEHGIVADFREPNVIRLAPAPLYNSFEDVYRAGEAMRACL